MSYGPVLSIEIWKEILGRLPSSSFSWNWLVGIWCLDWDNHQEARLRKKTNIHRMQHVERTWKFPDITELLDKQPYLNMSCTWHKFSFLFQLIELRATVICSWRKTTDKGPCVFEDINKYLLVLICLWKLKLK